MHRQCKVDQILDYIIIAPAARDSAGALTAAI